MFKSSIAIAATALMFTVTVSAHDVWFEPAGKEHRLVYGHPGELEPYDPRKTRSVTAIDRHGKKSKLDTRIENEHLYAGIPSGAVLVVTDFDNGFWTANMDDEYFNVSKQEVPNYKTAMHSKKFNKALFAWSDVAGKPVGADFEVVPLTNPLALKPGDRLPVQLLYKGKPLAGAEIEILGDMELYTTDKDGKASLPISADSFQYVLARHKETLNNHPDADTLALETNLTFYR